MERKDPMRLVRSLKSELMAPIAYWSTPSAEVDALIGVGKCGPGGGMKEKVVPETIWGLRITPSCRIHDFMYKVLEKTKANKNIADRIFILNLLHQIDQETKRNWLKWLRRRRAYKYYDMVALFGDSSFWK